MKTTKRKPKRETLYVNGVKGVATETMNGTIQTGRYGVRFLSDLGAQLNGTYKATWDAERRVLRFRTDRQTADRLSRLTGQITMEFRTGSRRRPGGLLFASVHAAILNEDHSVEWLIN
ncbi:hypothetical protein DNFV4_00316 [Nitrospira tepida]|uniref:Uncharacterized protein n=1 Tax=Nitrospira tepida TaxID=2973512 RepID=A0AA86MVS1_9BACT|nr:hypothetical protein [Nitrospira tepida]CAI4029896.1 hypothetical protein DNFV4_00316 [Nitrospira tepida]